MLILLRKINKMKHYDRNESTIALLGGKLLNANESVINM